MEFGLNWADITVIAGSLIAVLTIGLWAGRKRDQSASQYFLAERKLPWWMIGAAFVSTSVSSEQMVGTVGKAYQHGMGVANWEWFTLPGYCIVIGVFIPIYLKNRITTVSEFLARRFGPRCSDVYSWVMLAAYTGVFLVTILYSGALAFASITGWNFHAVLWTIAVLIAAYTIRGGMASVMWADTIQCLLLVGGGLVLFFVALGQIPGGWAAMQAARPDRFHLYQGPNDPLTPFAGLLAGISTGILFYQAANQTMIQRVLGARSLWDGILGIIWAGFINLVRPLVTCFLGFIVFHWVHEMGMAPGDVEALDKNPDLTFPFALRTFPLHAGLRGVVLAGFLAAVMSATSSLVNSTATLFSLDVYRKLIRPAAADREVVLAGKIASLAALTLAALLAPSVEHFGGIFKFFQTGVTYLATPFATVLLLGVFWRRANYASALFGLVGGLAIQAAVALIVPHLLRETSPGELPDLLRPVVSVVADDAGREVLQMHWFYLASLAQAVIAVGMVAVALTTSPPEADRIRSYTWTPALLLAGHEGPRPWYQRLTLWFSVYATLWFYLYWRFW